MARTKIMRKEFRYLNRLRESGATNMYGAAPYLEMEFDMTRREARQVLIEWMAWVEENPDNRDL
jgi:hypothetical protein